MVSARLPAPRGQHGAGQSACRPAVLRQGKHAAHQRRDHRNTTARQPTAALTTARRCPVPTPQPVTTAAADDANGLRSAEAARRLQTDGPNLLAQGSQRGLRAMATGVAAQPMLLLQLVRALVYALVGSVAGAALLLVSVLAVGGISLVQDYRTERVLDSLQQLSSPRACLVRDGTGDQQPSQAGLGRACLVRDGTVQWVASQALVTGHHLRIAEGDRLACDATLLGANGLRVDESLRSGESAPVLKSASQALHAGTPVVSGAGTATVCATGAATTLGRIGGGAGDVHRPGGVCGGLVGDAGTGRVAAGPPGALRAAGIGVVMGRRGTDVAREAAVLVLPDHSFAALVSAVRMGRRIFGNLRNAVAYLIAVHVPIVAVSLRPVLLGMPVLLLPLHLVLLELVIDPACPLVFEAEAEPPAPCTNHRDRPRCACWRLPQPGMRWALAAWRWHRPAAPWRCADGLGWPQPGCGWPRWRR